MKVAVTAAFAFALIAASQASFLTDCGGTAPVVRLNSASVSPDPIRYPGNVNFTANVFVDRDLPSTALVHLEVTKVFSFPLFPIPVPCLNGYLGTCQFNLCEAVKANQEFFGAFLPKDANGVACPIRARTYASTGQLRLDFISSDFSKLVQGTLKVKMTIMDGTQKLGCWSGELNITL